MILNIVGFPFRLVWGIAVLGIGTLTGMFSKAYAPDMDDIKELCKWVVWREEL